MRKITLALFMALLVSACSDGGSSRGTNGGTVEDDGTEFPGGSDLQEGESLRSEARSLFGELPTSVELHGDNPPNESKIELGRLLFWDPVLSGDGDVACATCHHPSMGYSETLPLSRGVGAVGLGEGRHSGFLVKRNAPTVINSAFNGIVASGDYDPVTAPMFWDNRESGLEAQSLLPIKSMEEMRGENFSEDEILPEVVQRLRDIPEYLERFVDAFGDEDITAERIAQAIASFERTIIAVDTPFDRYMRGDEQALTEGQKEGLEVFIETGCADCHDGPMLTNYDLHVIGVPESAESIMLPELDNGAGNFEFRTPTLRNLSLTAPYMHNGVHEDLDEVMEFYFDAVDGEDIHHQLTLADLDEDIRDLAIDLDDEGDDDEDGGDEEGEDENDGEVEARLQSIVEFLSALEDNNFDRSVPESVPSGLSPGGMIDE